MRVERSTATVERVLLALVSIALLSVAYARADDHPTARLVYDRDASARQCPDEPELRDLVSARLGYVPFRDDATAIVTTRIEATPRGLRATVEARNEAGEITGRREIVSRTRDCQELARGVALAISVAIDPFVLTGGAPPPTPVVEDAGVPDASSTSDAGLEADADAGEDTSAIADAAIFEAVVDAAQARVEDVPIAPDGIRFALGGAIGVGFGAVPDPRPYFAIDVALDHPHFLLRLVTRFDLPASDSRPIGGSVSASRLLGRIDACGVYRFLFGCGGFGARLYFARGDDVAQTRSATEANFALTPQIGTRIRLTETLRLHAAFGLDFALRRASLELDDRAVFRESRIAPFVEVGVVWRIP